MLPQNKPEEDILAHAQSKSTLKMAAPVDLELKKVCSLQDAEHIICLTHVIAHTF